MAGALLGPGLAAAEECTESTKRWVAVRLHGPGWTPDLAESVLTDLQVEERHHGIAVCRADRPGHGAPMVTLEIEAEQPSAMRMSLDITDPASGKQPVRELVLDSVPPDGHSLAVAVAADELLTSSWIKLVSRPSAEPPVPPPPAPAMAPTDVGVRAPPREPAPRRWELALLAATERLDGSAWTAGLDLAARRWPLSHGGLELAAGARGERATTAPHGRLRSRAFPVSLRLFASAVPAAARARAGVAGAFTATPLRFTAEPDPGASASSQTALALHLRGELWADLRLGRFRLRASGGVGTALRSVTADDTGVAVGGARGLAWYGQLGLGLEL